MKLHTPIAIIILLTLLSSCDPAKRMQRKIDRAENKIEKLTIKYPQLLKRDTVHDTVKGYVPLVTHDTAFIDVPGDTVTIENERVKVEYVRQLDSIYLNVISKPDTIEIPVEIPCETITVTKESDLEYFVKEIKKKLAWVIAALILLIIVILAVKLLKPI